MTHTVPLSLTHTVAALVPVLGLPGVKVAPPFLWKAQLTPSEPLWPPAPARGARGEVMGGEMEQPKMEAAGVQPQRRTWMLVASITAFINGLN